MRDTWRHQKMQPSRRYQQPISQFHITVMPHRSATTQLRKAIETHTQQLQRKHTDRHARYGKNRDAAEMHCHCSIGQTSIIILDTDTIRPRQVDLSLGQVVVMTTLSPHLPTDAMGDRRAMLPMMTYRRVDRRTRLVDVHLCIVLATKRDCLYLLR